MYSKDTKPKASKGSVQIKNSNGRLQLAFSHAGKRHYLSLGLADSKLNRRAAEAKAKLIESDIAYDRLDSTLARYKPRSALSTVTSEVTSIFTPSPTLAQLWEQYTEFKRTQVSQSTLVKDYANTAAHIKKLPTDSIEDAVEIRDYLVKKLTANAAKRCLVQINASCDWAVSSGLISSNPFRGMAAEIKLPKSQASEHDINPFSASERDEIIQAFESDRYYNHYTSLVRFLFNTGCRPSEAVALQWKHVSPDFRLITFEQAVTMSVNGLALKSGLKTQEKRRFPCNESLRGFLKSIKTDNAKPGDLVFPSPKKKFIDFHNFVNRPWKSVLGKLDFPYRKPYQTRHTFITLCLDNGLDAKDVARLVGNSPEIVYRHYAGNKRELFVPEF